MTLAMREGGNFIEQPPSTKWRAERDGGRDEEMNRRVGRLAGVG